MTNGWVFLIVLALLGCLLNFILCFANIKRIDEETIKARKDVKRSMEELEENFKRKINMVSDSLSEKFNQQLNIMFKDWHLITEDAATWPPLNTMVLITNGNIKHILSFGNYETFQKQDFYDDGYFWHIYEGENKQ